MMPGLEVLAIMKSQTDMGFLFLECQRFRRDLTETYKMIRGTDRVASQKSKQGIAHTGLQRKTHIR